TFKACIISSKRIGDNPMMENNHFYKKDDSGKDYSIINKPSYLVVNHSFKKETNWLKEPIRSGKLTELGVKFVEDNIKPVELSYSNKHISKIKKP
ncbi:hypothetical protein, partial [Elizabethkingia anophelis]